MIVVGEWIKIGIGQKNIPQMRDLVEGYFKNKTLIISSPYTIPNPIAEPFNIVIPTTANGIISPPYLSL